MDKEDCTQVLLSTLQKPQWKSGNSVTDWDLKDILWRSGVLLCPDQVSALLADVKRRGLISARERREDNRLVALWGVRITPAGEEWLAQRATPLPVAAASARSPEGSPSVSAPMRDETEPESSQSLVEPMQASLR